MRAFRTVFGITLLVAGLTTTTQAQLFNSISYSRPSEQSPSSLIGLVGGRSTQSSYNVQSLSRPTFSFQADRGYYGNPAGPRSGGFSPGYGSAGTGGMALSSALVPGSPRVFVDSIDYGLMRGGAFGVDLRQRPQQLPIGSTGRVSAGELYYAADFTDSTRFDAPIGGWSLERIRITNDQPYIVFSEPRTAFQEAFGLAPSSAEPPTRDGSVGLGALVEEDRQLHLGEEGRRGLEAFRQCMVQGGEERYGLMTRAQLLLSALAQMDRKNPLPPLLLTHIAIERDHTDSALAGLVDAIQRDPNVIASAEKLRVYFGDPAMLERQARMLIRLKEDVPSIRIVSLQAYGAWLLGDTQRIEDSLKLLEKLSNTNAADKRGRSVFSAISAAARAKRDKP